MAVLYSPMGGLYAHISDSGQLFAPEYQHHRKVDLRRPLGTTDFDGMDARDKTGSYNSYRHFRGTHSSRHDSCDAREAAEPGQWDLVLIALCAHLSMSNGAPIRSGPSTDRGTDE